MASHIIVVDRNGTITVNIYYLNNLRIYTSAGEGGIRAILENYMNNKCEEDLPPGNSNKCGYNMTEIPRYADPL